MTPRNTQSSPHAPAGSTRLGPRKSPGDDLAGCGRFEYAELWAVLPGERGFECTFYWGLATQTHPLREVPYVTAEAEADLRRMAEEGEGGR